MKHPGLCRDWHQRSSYLILLSVTDEPELTAWLNDIQGAGVDHAAMHEPDLGGQLTAVAVAPHVWNARFSGLPLQGRELAMT